METQLLTQREINHFRADFWFDDFLCMAAATGILWGSVTAIGACLL